MRSIVLRTLVACIGFCTTSRAEFDFEFVSEADDKALATLTVAAFSSTPSDLLSLRFTEKGQGIFGYGEDYAGNFDVMSEAEDFGRLFTDIDSAGRIGLGGGASGSMSRLIQVTDLDPPSSVLEDAAITRALTITAVDNTNNDVVLDELTLWYYTSLDASPESSKRLSVSGRWLLVPEPAFSTRVLFALVVPSLLCRRRGSNFISTKIIPK